ncbi:MAG: DEAD/DEAH box helicase family protein [Candidatus Shapirobacteria bacterium]
MVDKKLPRRGEVTLIKVTLHNQLYLKFHTKDLDYLRALKEYFSDHTPGYIFDPRFRSGIWDGRVSIFNGRERTLPYGVLPEFLRFHKSEFAGRELDLDPGLKLLFSGANVDIKYDLNLEPRPYQKEIVEKALKYGRGIIRSATASGKSLGVSFIINNLEKITRQQLIIVPNISLIEQFHSDMIEYGIDPAKIGKVGDGNLEFDKKIVISTWQTLANNLDKLDLYDTVICDETHSVKALVVRTLLSQMPRARYRFGFTGTLPDNKLDLWNIMSFLGPVLLDISSAKLADEGYVSYCNVNQVNMHYSNKYGGTYAEMKEKIFNIPFRLNFIKEIVEKVDSNFLILVGMVRKEGQVLLEYLKEQLPNKEVIFLSGKDPSEEREIWRKNMDKDSDLVLIATYPIFQQGINIPSLKYLIFAAPYKSKIRILQSIGRTLRKHDTKDTGAEIIDIIDHTKYFKKQSVDRLKHYVNEEFNIREFDIYEDRYNIDSLIREIT